MRRSIVNNSRLGQLVYDPARARLIAAEMTGRICCARGTESIGTTEALVAVLHRADCRIFTAADHAGSTEQFHARRCPNNATRLSGIEWLWPTKRA
jgi:hypothetical protein